MSASGRSWQWLFVYFSALAQRLLFMIMLIFCQFTTYSFFTVSLSFLFYWILLMPLESVKLNSDIVSTNDLECIRLFVQAAFFAIFRLYIFLLSFFLVERLWNGTCILTLWQIIYDNAEIYTYSTQLYIKKLATNWLKPNPFYGSVHIVISASIFITFRNRCITNFSLIRKAEE